MSLDPTLAGWLAFFNTSAEAAATLAGLVMVAISVNVREIISYSHMPVRALGAVSALVLVLGVSLAALVPQPLHAFAIEAAIDAVLCWGLHILVAAHVVAGHRQLKRPTRETVFGLIVGQSQVWPVTIGAVLLLRGDPVGIYWVAGTVAVALSMSVLNAWILLVEILR